MLCVGEVAIAEAQNVLLFAPVSEQKQGKSGSLWVTNFKLTFVTTEERPKEVTCCSSYKHKKYYLLVYCHMF